MLFLGPPYHKNIFLILIDQKDDTEYETAKTCDQTNSATSSLLIRFHIDEQVKQATKITSYHYSRGQRSSKYNLIKYIYGKVKSKS